MRIDVLIEPGRSEGWRFVNTVKQREPLLDALVRESIQDRDAFDFDVR